MNDKPGFEQFFKQFSAALPGIPQELEKNMRAGMNAAFARMDLVTREEFDIQAAVLARTRAKLEALEQRVTALEQAAGRAPPHIMLAQRDNEVESPSDSAV
jgi:ubiquinone biosynthesis accessory factor UbiK